MHVCWSFLDKRQATIDALKSYHDMEFIIQNTSDEIKTVRVEMEGIGAVNVDRLPHAHNKRAGEERIIGGIEKIDILRERYRQAEEYMAWFKPAWERLTDDERFVLEAFYVKETGYKQVMQHFCIERSSANNKKYRALDRLTVMLYGKK